MKKFMTNFEQIKLFVPYLQTLSIVIDAHSLNINNKDLIFAYEELDINKTPIVNRKFAITMRFPPNLYDEGIHHICINPFYSILNETKYIKYTLENGNNATNVVAEKIAEICKVDSSKENVQIIWQNNLGGFDAWNFKAYEIEGKIEKTDLFQTYAARNSKIYNKEASLKIKVYDIVDKEYIEGLFSLATARQVWIEDNYEYFFKYRSLRQDKNIEIVPDSTSLKIQEVREGKYSFELNFVLTKINV